MMMMDYTVVGILLEISSWNVPRDQRTALASREKPGDSLSCLNSAHVSQVTCASSHPVSMHQASVAVHSSVVLAGAGVQLLQIALVLRDFYVASVDEYRLSYRMNLLYMVKSCYICVMYGLTWTL